MLIALFIHDSFIRPYFGDYLVVMLIYCAIKTFLKTSTLKIAAGVLVFSYVVEILQYLHIVDRLGLSGNVIAKTVIGYGFEWWDILAYTLGVITILIVEGQATKLHIEYTP
jgi:DNA integrity scanning protein DisA with diadenylate cyclase activity